jgi:hypothetical protein
MTVIQLIQHSSDRIRRGTESAVQTFWATLFSSTAGPRGVLRV